MNINILCNLLQQNSSSTTGGTSPFDNSQTTNASNQQVWLIVGDSISRGSSANGDQGPSPYFTDTIFQYTSGAISAVNTGDLATASTGSPWMKFGIDYYRRTSRKIVFVPQGSGGSNFYPDGDNNNWYTSGSLYATAVSQANAALVANGTTKLRGILMILGINDASAVDAGTVTLSEVQTGVDSLFTRLNASFPGVPIHVYNIGRNTAGVSSNVTAIRAMIEQAALTYQNVYIVQRLQNHLDKYQPDLLHLSQYGNDYVSAEAVKNMLSSGLISNEPITRVYGSEAQTVFANFTGNNSLTDKEKGYLNDFIMYMQGIGEWSLIDSMYMFLLDSQSKALQDLKRGSKQAINNGATWSSTLGFSTTGSISSYIDSNFIPSTDGINYVLNNAMGGFYLLQNDFSDTTFGVLMGCVGSVSTGVFSIGHSSSGTITRIHNSTGGSSTSLPLQAPGFYSIARSSSTATAARRDGVAVATTNSSVTLPNRSIKIGVRDNNGTIDSPYTGKFGLAFFGAPPPSNYLRFWGKFREVMIDFQIQ